MITQQIGEIIFANTHPFASMSCIFCLPPLWAMQFLMMMSYPADCGSSQSSKCVGLSVFTGQEGRRNRRK